VPDGDDDCSDEDQYAKILSQPQHGKLEQDRDGRWFYTADAGFIGTDTFTYALSTGELDSKPATVTIMVLPPKRPPVANDATISVPSERPSPINILANASDPDGQALTAHIVDGPHHGCLQHNNDGSYTYVPQDEWFGDDSFSYYVDDNEAKSNIATVHIKVIAIPTASDARFTVNDDGKIRIDLRRLVDDPDENAEANLSISVSNPSHGKLIRQKDGTYVYEASSGFRGADTFTYTVSDGINSATAIISVNANNDDDDDDCDYSQTVMIQASIGQNDGGQDNYRYIVVNQGKRRHSDGDDSQLRVNWDDDGHARGGHSEVVGSDWWNALVAEPLLNSADLAKQSGLVVKRMN
jgi:hypothetical protein